MTKLVAELWLSCGCAKTNMWLMCGCAVADVWLCWFDRDSKKQDAYAAQEGTSDTSQPYSPEAQSLSDSKEYKVAAATPNAKGKLLPNQQLLNSGALVYITNNPSCFRGPLTPLRRRQIKVGGGHLQLDLYRKVVIRDKRESQIKLDILFVPRLRVNLISRKKLYIEYYLYSLIKLDSFTIVLYNFVPYLTFTKKNSIYILSKIAKQLSYIQLGKKKYTMLYTINANVEQAELNANVEQAELDLGLKEARELPLVD